MNPISRKLKTKFFSLGIAALMLAGILASPPASVRAAVCSISAVPSVANVAAGGTFDLAIRISTDTACRGAQFLLTYDPAQVQINTYNKGTFFDALAAQYETSGGQLFWTPNSPQIDNAAGKFPKQVSLTGTTLAAVAAILGNVGDGIGATGQGDLYILHMQAKAGFTGVANFTLTNTRIGDATAEIHDLLPVVVNGSITIGQQQQTSPAMTTAAAGSITSTTATLNGNLTSMGTATSASVSFEWGTSTAYGSETAVETKSATGAYTFNLTGLTASTTYHYRAKAVVGGVTVTGTDQAFNTTATGTTAPAVTTSAATALVAASATLNGNLTGLGGNNTVAVSFEYGTTTAYGSATTPQDKTATGAFTAGITGLTANTTYHCRAKATVGSTSVYGSDVTFTTINLTPALAVTTGANENVTATGVKLNGNLTAVGTDVIISVNFEYGTTTSYGSSTASQSLTAAGTYSATLSGLTPGTTYHYRAKAVGSATVTGADSTFTTTAPPTTPPPATTTPAQGEGALQVLDLSSIIDAGGVLQEDFSTDLKYGTNWITVSLKRGTRAVQSDGYPLTALSIMAPITLAAPASSIRPILVYELGPSGAIFSQPVTFVYQFDATQLPTGASVNDLYMAYFDPVANAWERCDFTLDAANNRITARLSHFSMYGMFATVGTGLMAGNGGFGWSLAAVVILSELLIGGLIVALLLRRRQPTPAMARAQYYYPEPANMPQTPVYRPAPRPAPAPRSNREPEVFMWDELLKNNGTAKAGFKTQLEIIGGRLVLPVTDNSADIEISANPEQRTLISLEFNPESNPRATAKIKVVGSSPDIEKSKEMKHDQTYNG